MTTITSPKGDFTVTVTEANTDTENPTITLVNCAPKLGRFKY